MQSLDLSVDFADWSEAGLEVKNTFLHVCSTHQSRSVKSDYICNYTLYREPESDSESLLAANAENFTAEKLKNKRPGKKARARMQRRSNRCDTIASIASISTEASSDQDTRSPRSEHELGIEPKTLCSVGLSGLAVVEGAHSSTPPHCDSALSQAPVVDPTTPRSAFIELPLPAPACVANEALVELQAQDFDVTMWGCGSAGGSPMVKQSVQMVANEALMELQAQDFDVTMWGCGSPGGSPMVKQSVQMEAEKSEPDVLPERSEVVERTVLVASSFLFGALFVTVLLGLLWSTGVVQIQVAQGTMERCHQIELKAFKEDIEARLAVQERRLQDVAEITETMPSQQPPDTEARLASQECRINDVAGTAETMPIQRQPVVAGLSSPTGNNAVRGRVAPPVAAAPEPDLSPSEASLEKADQPFSNAHERDVASLDGPPSGWLDARSLCCVWLSLVLLCSMAQMRAPWIMNKGFGKISNPVIQEAGQE